MTEVLEADRAARDKCDTASSSTMLPWWRRATIVRVLRCLFVSVGTTVLSAMVLVTLAVGFGVPAGTASLIANGCGIPPSYVANRRWVWRRAGRGDLAREVVPFWILSLSGLVVSTWVVGYVGTLTAALPASGRVIALPAANVGVFAALWLVQFVLLDRVIFHHRDLGHDAGTHNHPAINPPPRLNDLSLSTEHEIRAKLRSDRGRRRHCGMGRTASRRRRWFVTRRRSDERDTNHQHELDDKHNDLHDNDDGGTTWGFGISRRLS